MANTIKPVNSNSLDFKHINSNYNSNATFKMYEPVDITTVNIGKSIKGISTDDATRNVNGIIADSVEETAATNFVISGKIISGVYDVNESIYDGLLWTGGKIVDGASYVIGKIAGWFNKDAEQSIMDWRSESQDSVREYIAVDVGENLENSFYNTNLGKRIDNSSRIKHNSYVANYIENISKTGTEFVAATATTIASGGTAAPVLLAGFLEGVGEQSQKTYSKSENVTTMQELGIGASGIATGTRWWALGRLGNGLVDITSQIHQIAQGGFNTSLGNVSEIVRRLWETRRHRDAARVWSRAINDALFSTDDLIDTVNGIFDTIADSLNNGNMSFGETAAKVVTGVVQNVGTNVLMNRFVRLPNDFRTPDPNNSLDGQIISLVHSLFETADATEDSGVVDVDIYDIGKKIVDDIQERSN